MKDYFNPAYPDIDYLRKKAQKRIPRFAFEYLDGGCNNEINLRRNTEEIRQIQLKPYYLRPRQEVSLKTTLLGESYDLPFGISPIGLQGLMWPGASEILAQAAYDHNIPYILSTVGTASLEKIAKITQGRAWFQLYNPVEDSLRQDLLKRLENSGYKVLVILSDVPSFGYRAKEIRNGLSIPPKMTLRNMIQIASKPNWALSTLKHGQPYFETLKPYIPKGMSLRHLGLFMNKTFSGKLGEEKLKQLRDQWKGTLVLKGVASVEDAQKAIQLGIDGIIVSNHGGRQLDAGPSSIYSLKEINKEIPHQTTLMMDSGIRTGSDIANCLASGAAFTFLGRSFMYGVSALGKKGGHQTVNILKKQLYQILEQLSCARINDLHKYLI